MKSIAFFNNKGGVGKTTLGYHLSWMFAELGYSVVAADLDPQANLTAMFLDEDRLEELWPDGNHPQSILSSVSPILRGLGDVSEPHVEEVTEDLGLIVGDLGLARFEAKLSSAWPDCLFRLKAADGALGGHIHAVQDCYRDFENLATAIAVKCRIGV